MVPKRLHAANRESMLILYVRQDSNAAASGRDCISIRLYFLIEDHLFLSPPTTTGTRTLLMSISLFGFNYDRSCLRCSNKLRSHSKSVYATHENGRYSPGWDCSCTSAELKHSLISKNSISMVGRIRTRHGQERQHISRQCFETSGHFSPMCEESRNLRLAERALGKRWGF